MLGESLMSDDIEYIKRKKFIEYMNRMLKAQSSPDKTQPSDVLERIKGFLSVEAYKYLLGLRNRDKSHFDKVLQVLVYMMLNGYIDVPVREKDVIVVDKKLGGYKGKIYVERRGELKEFGEAFREDS